MKRSTAVMLSVMGLCLMVPVTQAQPFEWVRIGDVDGFGWDTGGGLTAANGGACNVDGIGVLTAGDYLPDINLNGITATGQGDDWDNRSAVELAGTAVTATGASDFGGTTGSEYTDVTISTSFDEDPGVYPGFVFDFFVAAGDINPGADLFINVVFGDYDVSPASVRYTRADSTTFEVPLTLQGAGDDGLIQSAFASVPFSDVFSPEGATGWRGSLLVDFIAPSEPYLAFDFAEISTEAIGLECDPYSQGYWHRQCLGVPASEGGIDPGNGNGPQSPTEPDFVPELMDCADEALEDLGFSMTTCQGMDADPPNDPCEKAKKQLTAVVLNVCSGHLSLGCATDAPGCVSGTVGELLSEIAGLILDSACGTAQTCAASVNEGHGLADGSGGGSAFTIERESAPGRNRSGAFPNSPLQAEEM